MLAPTLSLKILNYKGIEFIYIIGVGFGTFQYQEQRLK